MLHTSIGEFSEAPPGPSCGFGYAGIAKKPGLRACQLRSKLPKPSPAFHASAPGRRLTLEGRGGNGYHMVVCLPAGAETTKHRQQLASAVSVCFANLEAVALGTRWWPSGSFLGLCRRLWSTSWPVDGHCLPGPFHVHRMQAHHRGLILTSVKILSPTSSTP